MKIKLTRISVAAVSLAAALFGAPAESHAIFEWLRGCCGGSTPTYAAAPLYSATTQAADPCCAPPQIAQTARYVPQTCYRTQYVSVPVTTYRPVAGRDPCTGCPVTCMRPATAYVQQARLIPYTTYRMVLSNPCCAAPAVTASYAPTYAAGASSAGSSCSGCGTAPTMSYAPAASAPYYGGGSAGTIVSPSNGYSAGGSSVGVPTTAPAAGAGGNPTFAPDGTQNLKRPVQPIPNKDATEGDQSTEESDSNDENSADSGRSSGTGAILSPRLFQPNDRTTSYPILRARVHRPVSFSEPTNEPTAGPVEPTPRTQTDDGWRPSTR